MVLQIHILSRFNHMAWTQRKVCLIRNVTPVPWLSPRTDSSKLPQKKNNTAFFFSMQDIFFFHWLKHNICTHKCKKFYTSPRKSYCLSDTADDFPLWTNWAIHCWCSQHKPWLTRKQEGYKSADKLRSTLFYDHLIQQEMSSKSQNKLCSLWRPGLFYCLCHYNQLCRENRKVTVLLPYETVNILTTWVIKLTPPIGLETLFHDPM